MSLSTTNVSQTVKKQFFFKLKANIDSLSSLIWIQLLAILFSFGGVSSMWSSNGEASIEVQYFTSDIVVVFTFIWSFVTAITITTKPYRHHDFTFVTNRLSSSLSNILFFLCANVIGSITAILSGNLISLIKYLFFDTQLYHIQSGLLESFGGIAITFLYLCMLSALGYLIGALVQLHKIFAVFIPLLFIGLVMISGTMQGVPFTIHLYDFYVKETSMLLFLLKSVITTILLLLPSISILNRLEVRR